MKINPYPTLYDTEVAATQDCPEEMARRVAKQDPNSPDGRSQWIWVRLSDGQLMLACFPQGQSLWSIESSLIV